MAVAAGRRLDRVWWCERDRDEEQPTGVAARRACQTSRAPRPRCSHAIRERHESLTRTINDTGASSSALADAYGEMGKLFLAAEYFDAAETCFVNAGALAPSDMRWPYYLGHAYQARAIATTRRQTSFDTRDHAAAESRAESRLAS